MNWIPTLGALLIGLTPAICQTPTLYGQATAGAPIENVRTLELLTEADVVYLGEVHDSEEDHAAQLEIVEALHAADPNLAIGLEMFQRPFQDAIDAYLAGEIDETELQRRTEYETRWGFPWEYYAPLLRLARDRGLPVLALNAPAETTRKVSREGLASLTEEERQYIPPFAEIRTDTNPAHREWVRKAFAQHDFTPSEDVFERFYTAQVVWDETMAATIAEFLQEKPTYRVVAIVGRGHMVYGYGIPDRVARRLRDRANLEQRLVIFADDPADFTEELEAEPPIADRIWIHP